MAPSQPQARLKILSVGGNAVSAFLSWRLSATNACDVTTVWKSGFDTVSQYGITFKSSNKALGQERFKPRHVVRTPEEAAQISRAPFDYVILCVKALPDVYDLAAVIESVVAPQHTCILINTTHSLGLESYLESRFPTNVVLSLVCGTDLQQVNTSEFEHNGSTEFWVGPANKNPGIPADIQSDMAEALAMTLSSGQVDCKVSSNIRQQQYERMIGPVAFQPTSVLFETPNHRELLDKTGVKTMITGVIDELMALAQAQGCTFAPEFAEKTLQRMLSPTESNSAMYQDYQARRPLEIETFLGTPVKLARETGIPIPRIQTLYALLHNLNTINQQREAQPAGPAPVSSAALPPRMSSASGPPVNGHGPMPMGMRGGRGPGRTSSVNGHGAPPPGMRRGPPPNAFTNGRPGLSRRPSAEGENLEEFSHLMLYDDISGEQLQDYGGHVDGNGPATGELSLRERELALRQREMALREREYGMRRGPPPSSRRMGPPQNGMYDDDDDDDDFVSSPPVGPPIDPDNFDMMSVTSRRTRKAPSAQQLRQNPEMNGGNRSSRNPFNKPKPHNRASARLMADVPGLHDSIMSNPLMGYSSDRYGNVDRHNLHAESRTNSLTQERLHELQMNGGYSGPFPPGSRRTSAAPMPSMNGRPGPGPGPRRSPPGEYHPGRPSPPGLNAPGIMATRAPMQGNAMAMGPGSQRIEQQAAVSHLYPPPVKPRAAGRSLTGSASASADSGESALSARLGSDPSAHSSSSSLGPRPPIGVR